MSNGTLRFWLSWEEPLDPKHGADPRPLKTLPPNSAVKHWWCSGEGEGYMTLCAVVDVNATEEAAMAVVAEYWRPQAWRFAERKGWAQDGWMPEASRFPVASGAAR